MLPQMFFTCTGIECDAFCEQRPALFYDVAKQHPSELSRHFCSDIICTRPLHHLRRNSLTKPRPAHTNWLLHLEDQNNGYSYLKICDGGGTTRSQRTVHRCNYCSVRTGRRVGASGPLQELRGCQNVLIEFTATETHTNRRQNTESPDLRYNAFCKFQRNSDFALLENASIYSQLYTYIRGHAVAQLVKALRYKPEGRGFDSRWCLWNFSLT